jgi:hypothetical protein
MQDGMDNALRALIPDGLPTQMQICHLLPSWTAQTGCRELMRYVMFWQAIAMEDT